MSTNKRPAFFNSNLDFSFDDEIPPTKKSKVTDSDDEYEMFNISDLETDQSDPKTDHNDKTNNLEKDTSESVDIEDPTDSKPSEKNDIMDRIGELKSKGISLSLASDSERVLSISKVSSIQSVTSSSSSNANNNNQVQDPKLTAFAKKVTSFVHEKNCLERCSLLSEDTRETLSELSEASICSPEFIRSCISLVSCCIRCGDPGMARLTISLVFRLSKIVGISPLCQALLLGVKAQTGSVDEVEELEVKGLEAIRSRHLLTAESFISKALKISPSCIRLKLVRGDILARLGKFTQAEKVATDILEKDESHVGANFLKAFSLYHLELMDLAVAALKQTLEHNPSYQRARILLDRVNLLAEKRDAASQAVTKGRLEEAVRLYSEALAVDPGNKRVRLSLLVDRGSLHLRLKRPGLGQRDCDEALRLDQHSAQAEILKARCLMESHQYAEAVSILETNNNKDRQAQQKKKHMAEVAARAKKLDEAMKLYEEVVALDKKNSKYRQLLKDAKQKHHLASRLDYYKLLGVEKTAETGDMKKAYFKKSREYHPDKHANATEQEKEEFSMKFKQAKEAYEVLSSSERRKVYDKGTVNPPPGGWYRDVDRRFLSNLKRMSEANILVNNPAASRGRSTVAPGRGGGPAPSMRTGPGITINKVPPTRGNTRGRRRRN